MFKNLLKKIVRLFSSKKGTIPVIIPPFEKAPDQTITPNIWSVVSAIEPNDKDHVLEVVYTNELGMTTITTCMVVFVSGNEYKLVSPELGSGKILQKANLTDLKINRILKPTDDN